MFHFFSKTNWNIELKSFELGREKLGKGFKTRLVEYFFLIFKKNCFWVLGVRRTVTHVGEKRTSGLTFFHLFRNILTV